MTVLPPHQIGAETTAAQCAPALFADHLCVSVRWIYLDTRIRGTVRLTQDVEGYWSKNHWGAIQGVIGVLCLAWTVWTYYNPYRASPKPGMEQNMRSFPPSLLAILCLLTLSLVAPAIAAAVRHFRKPKVDSFINSDREQKEAEKQAQMASLGSYAYGVLSAHQLGALSLAVTLRRLHERFGPRPLSDPLYDPWEGTRRDEDIHQFAARVQPWEVKFRTAFLTEFEGKIVSAVHGFGNEGWSDSKLNALLAKEVNADTANEIADRLACLTLNIEGLQLVPRQDSEVEV